MNEDDHRIHVSYDTRTPTVWRIERPYMRKTSLGEITVPAGFVFDGASVPGTLQDVLPSWGMYSGAALIHDWFYATKPDGVKRSEADRVFLELMLEDGVPRRRAWLMHEAVRKFGARCWTKRVSHDRLS